MVRVGSSSERTSDWFLSCNIKPRFHFLYLWCSFSELEAKFNADAFSFKSGIRISCLAQ
jgi:hypothetical protein